MVLLLLLKNVSLARKNRYFVLSRKLCSPGSIIGSRGAILWRGCRWCVKDLPSRIYAALDSLRLRRNRCYTGIFLIPLDYTKITMQSTIILFLSNSRKIQVLCFLTTSRSTNKFFQEPIRSTDKIWSICGVNVFDEIIVTPVLWADFTVILFSSHVQSFFFYLSTPRLPIFREIFLASYLNECLLEATYSLR